MAMWRARAPQYSSMHWALTTEAGIAQAWPNAAVWLDAGVGPIPRFVSHQTGLPVSLLQEEGGTQVFRPPTHPYRSTPATRQGDKAQARGVEYQQVWLQFSLFFSCRKAAFTALIWFPAIQQLQSGPIIYINPSLIAFSHTHIPLL